MSPARHRNTGLLLRLRLRSRHTGAHRVTDAEHLTDEALEVCIPTVAYGSDGDLSDGIRALLDSAGDDTTSGLAWRR